MQKIIILVSLDYFRVESMGQYFPTSSRLIYDLTLQSRFADIPYVCFFLK